MYTIHKERDNMNDITLARRYMSTFESARDRNIEFTLSLSEMRSILSRKVCPYTNEIMTDDDKDPNQKTLDRIDAARGYVSGNVIACCRKINSLKSNLTSKEILSMAKIVRRKLIHE